MSIKCLTLFFVVLWFSSETLKKERGQPLSKEIPMDTKKLVHDAQQGIIPDGGNVADPSISTANQVHEGAGGSDDLMRDGAGSQISGS